MKCRVIISKNRTRSRRTTIDRILEDLIIERKNSMHLYCDNKSTISIAHNQVNMKRPNTLKSIDILLKKKLDSGHKPLNFIERQHLPFDRLSLASSPTLNHK